MIPGMVYPVGCWRRTASWGYGFWTTRGEERAHNSQFVSSTNSLRGLQKWSNISSLMCRPPQSRNSHSVVLSLPVPTKAIPFLWPPCLTFHIRGHVLFIGKRNLFRSSCHVFLCVRRSNFHSSPSPQRSREGIPLRRISCYLLLYHMRARKYPMVAIAK